MSDEDLIEEEQWRITDKGRRFLEEQRAAKGQPADSIAMSIRLARFEAFTEAIEEVKAEGELRRSDVVSARAVWLRIEELRSAAKPRG